VSFFKTRAVESREWREFRQDKRRQDDRNKHDMRLNEREKVKF